MPSPLDDLARLSVGALMDEALVLEVRALRRELAALRDRGHPRVLIVDDDGLSHILAREISTGLGMPVDVARSAREARSLLGRYALVVVDLRLPDGRGVDVARDAMLPPVVVLYSGAIAEDLDAAAREIGASALSKDMDLDALIDALRAALASKRTAPPR